MIFNAESDRYLHKINQLFTESVKAFNTPARETSEGGRERRRARREGSMTGAADGRRKQERMGLDESASERYYHR